MNMKDCGISPVMSILIEHIALLESRLARSSTQRQLGITAIAPANQANSGLTIRPKYYGAKDGKTPGDMFEVVIKDNIDE